MAGRTSGPMMPQGYQDPALKQGNLVNQDQVKETGAPAGYQWDPVKGAYLRTPASLGSDFSSLMSAVSGFGGTGTGGVTTSGPSQPVNTRISSPSLSGLQQSNSIPGIGPIDTSAAESAAFAKAKDQTGQEAAGALTGLRSALGGRGMLGSGAESRGSAAVINRGQGEMGDVSRQQAIDKAGLAERTATTNQAAGITQRGQDITRQGQEEEAAQAGYQGQIAQRGQDISAQIAANNVAAENARAQAAQRQSMLTGLMSALSATNRGAY